MRRLLSALALMALGAGLPAAPAPAPAPVVPKPALSAERLAAGWVQLTDGVSPFGWDGGAIIDGQLTFDAGLKEARHSFTTPLPDDFDFEATLTVAGDAWLAVGPGGRVPLKPGAQTLAGKVRTEAGRRRVELTGAAGKQRPAPAQAQFTPADSAGPATFGFGTAPGASVAVRSLIMRPAATKPIFDGKSLDGWDSYRADPKRAQSDVAVTSDGEISIKGGPGDLFPAGQYADFCLQLECKTLAKGLNSGVFFRCIPGEYQNGYEAQIHNGVKDNDPAKPADFGTGAVYRRTPARAVLAEDGKWFPMTVLAVGRHITTFVNGVAVVAWKDEREPHANPRQGYRAEAGHISLQGHDPTTDLLFRNLRIQPIAAAK